MNKFVAYMKSPEWQSQMENIREMQKAAAARARECLDSAEWKEQMQQLQEMLRKILENIKR